MRASRTEMTASPMKPIKQNWAKSPGLSFGNNYPEINDTYDFSYAEPSSSIERMPQYTYMTISEHRSSAQLTIRHRRTVFSDPVDEDCTVLHLNVTHELNGNWVNRSSIDWEAPSSRQNFVLKILLQNLGRISENWAGPETRGPSDSVIKDLKLALGSLPAGSKMPETEVDPDDGTVVLRWADISNDATFSLTFVGCGEVTGFLLEQSPCPAWKLDIRKDILRLRHKLNDGTVSNLITGR